MLAAVACIKIVSILRIIIIPIQGRIVKGKKRKVDCIVFFLGRNGCSVFNSVQCEQYGGLLHKTLGFIQSERAMMLIETAIIDAESSNDSLGRTADPMVRDE